jgi:Tol biopolymer transport system component
MRSIRAAAALVCAAGFVASVQAGPVTRRVSVDFRGNDPTPASYVSSLSGDGRYVAFYSFADSIVRGDSNRQADVFVRDMAQNTTVRASDNAKGEDANGYSISPSISEDGRYVAFVSLASDIVLDDGNGTQDVFLRDLLKGVTVRVSVAHTGGDADASSWEPQVSRDGRYVAFWSYASNLVPADGSGNSDVFVRDMVAGVTTRVSVDMDGGDADNTSWLPVMTPDGRYIAFWSIASDLVPGDVAFKNDVFVRDMVAGVTTRVSVDKDGGEPELGCFDPSISADGRYVAFWSESGDLVEGDGNGVYDVFVRDMVAGTTTRVSVDPDGNDPNTESYQPSISADGRYVVYWSYASNLVEGDGNDASDVFLRDLVLGVTTRISVDPRGEDANSHSYDPWISADGAYVSYTSAAQDVTSGDNDGRYDVFMTPRP